MHPARVVFCKKECLADMTDESFIREGGTRYWSDKDAYIEAMGGWWKTPYVLRFEHFKEEEKNE